MNTTENKHQLMEAIWNDCYQKTSTLRQCYEMAMDRWAEQSRQAAVTPALPPYSDVRAASIKYAEDQYKGKEYLSAEMEYCKRDFREGAEWFRKEASGGNAG